MRKLLFAPALTAIVVIASPSFAADDNVRSAQEKLATLGFYTGTPDGELNTPTRGALRRFQIYKGLNASGELDAETRAALAQEQGEAEETAAPPSPADSPSSTAQSDREFLEKQPPTPIPQPSAPRSVNLTRDDAGFFQEWYRKTPYENAPAEVQVETFRKIRALLKDRAFYEGEESLLPGPEMEEALFRYQSSRRLRLTGRPDLETLASLRLLPQELKGHTKGRTSASEASSAPLKPFIDPDHAPATSGAVRGIPLD